MIDKKAVKALFAVRAVVDDPFADGRWTELESSLELSTLCSKRFKEWISAGGAPT
jgi:hypothetical protein